MRFQPTTSQSATHSQGNCLAQEPTVPVKYHSTSNMPYFQVSYLTSVKRAMSLYEQNKSHVMTVLEIFYNIHCLYYRLQNSLLCCNSNCQLILDIYIFILLHCMQNFPGSVFLNYVQRRLIQLYTSVIYCPEYSTVVLWFQKNLRFVQSH